MTRSIPRLEPRELAVGTDTTITISLYGSTGDSLSVAGATATWNLYVAVPRRGRKPFKGNTVLTKTSALSQITLSTGSAAVAITDADLTDKSGLYWQELLVTASDGSISCHGQGNVRVRAAP